ncbi:hypothetical protein SKAU_G00171290 [Synaphobranchus kaupii]|uniref:Uncharacterized protein n=1 Tax=Synaphobranchus kaupii TaxID=118154 RepID=A0A9Q1FKG7_SYNKA|nr:hypothetical protein SKAU_G00171290 [Synaphobranchus kaupii]
MGNSSTTNTCKERHLEASVITQQYLSTGTLSLCTAAGGSKGSIFVSPQSMVFDSRGAEKMKVFMGAPETRDGHACE